jgi:hypothetical protein
MPSLVDEPAGNINGNLATILSDTKSHKSVVAAIARTPREFEGEKIPHEFKSLNLSGKIKKRRPKRRLKRKYRYPRPMRYRARWLYRKRRNPYSRFY